MVQILDSTDSGRCSTIFLAVFSIHGLLQEIGYETRPKGKFPFCWLKAVFATGTEPVDAILKVQAEREQLDSPTFSLVS